MTKHLCLGGHFDGMFLSWEDSPWEDDYIPYNCGSHYSRTKRDYRIAERKNDIVPPGMVYIHKSLLRKKKDDRPQESTEA